MSTSQEGIARHDSADYERHDSTAQLLKRFSKLPTASGSFEGDEEDFAYLDEKDRTQKDSADLWMWEDNPQSREVLLALFMMVDKLGDGSGSMSSTELMHVLINLGEDVDDEIADVRTAQPPTRRAPSGFDARSLRQFRRRPRSPLHPAAAVARALG